MRLGNLPILSGGIRKASVLMLGQLFRLKLDNESQDNINVNDWLTLTTHNAVLSAQGEYYALHPVIAGEYDFINTFKAGGGGSGEKGDTFSSKLCNTKEWNPNR